MLHNEKIPNQMLLNAGLRMMRQVEEPLEKMRTRGRAMIYRMRSGQTVRVRTCNDHVLVALAESPDENARVNIEGTDYLLIVMPRVPRSLGPIDAYLVPTTVAVEAARATHREWLATNPNTKGDNRTWNIWFDDDGPAKSSGFARHWSNYKIQSEISTHDLSGETRPTPKQPSPMTLGDVITETRQQIADAAGVPLEAVKITVDLAS